MGLNILALPNSIGVKIKGDNVYKTLYMKVVKFYINAVSGIIGDAVAGLKSFTLFHKLPQEH